MALSLWLVGVVLVVGNLTGWFPTFPYAGAIAQIIASLLTAFAQAQRLDPTPTSRPPTSIITIVFLFALSAAGWLSVAAALTEGSAVALRLLVSMFFSAVFVVLASKAIRVARQPQNGGSSDV